MPPEFRDWRLVKLTGWTFAEIDAANAHRCDWLLAIESVALEVDDDRQRRAMEEAKEKR